MMRNALKEHGAAFLWTYVVVTAYCTVFATTPERLRGPLAVIQMRY